MLETKWIYRQMTENKPDHLRLETLKKLFFDTSGLSPLISDILINRGIESIKECDSFVNPELTDLYDPFLLMDMEKSITRILKARDQNEKIILYGDYDADGTIGVAILYLFLKKNGFDVDYYIPNRLVTGYGLHREPLTELIESGMNLLITVDNGISAVAEIEFCNAHGVDVIVTDHHECHGLLPAAFSIINPKRLNSDYPYPELCGAGVAFKLIQGLSLKQNNYVQDLAQDSFQEMIECVAVATVADLVPLTGENRTLVSLGLQYLNVNPQNLGIRQLMKVSELKEVKAWHFGFILGPKINAAGRLGQADKIVALLTTDDPKKAYQLAEFLSAENKKRQDLEKEILNKAMEEIEEKELFKKDLILVSGENWHSGVIGIVASRIQERYYRPVIVIGIVDTIGKGSCRSVEGFNLFKALSSFGHLFTSFGGHEQAAGFSILKENIKNLELAFDSYAKEINLKAILQKRLYYDQQLSLENLTWALYDELTLFEPCGIKNPGIQFLIDNPPIKSYGKMGKEKNHLWIDFDGIRGIGFGMGEYGKILAQKEASHFAGLAFIVKLTINEYQGNKTLQLQLKDIKINPLHTLIEAKKLVDYLKNEENINFQDLSERINGLDFKNLDIPIQKLRKTYRFLKACGEKKTVLMDVFAKIALSPYEALMSLEILKENQLIDFSLNENVLQIGILPVCEKKDIKNSHLMIKLKKIITTKGA